MAELWDCVTPTPSSASWEDGIVQSPAPLFASGIGPKMPQLLAMGTAGAAANKALAPFPGGVLCRDAAGALVGAIGVSGAASDEDEHCAITAAQSVGLSTEPAASRLV
mmetsp:Transcript_18807/g.60098  ORF Transcript_18807/g.60098 Transcript_18807/m.60098 type:complete len:108 (-) Transcript_18807:127-450(-)